MGVWPDALSDAWREDLNDDERQALSQRLVDQALAEGVDLGRPEGLMKELTKQVLETALDEEQTEHLGYERSCRASKPAAGDIGGTSAPGRRSKTVVTHVGPVTINVPRDRDGTLDRRIIRKRQRRLAGWAQLVEASRVRWRL